MKNNRVNVDVDLVGIKAIALVEKRGKEISSSFVEFIMVV